MSSLSPRARQDTTATPVLRLLLRYPDGPRDAETLLVDPARRRMFVLSKGLFSSTAYAVPASAWDGTAPLRPAVRSATLVPVGRVPLSLVTDGTVATDGAVLLRTYGELAVLGPLPVDPPPSGRGTATLTPRATVSLPSQRQGEGLALTPDGGSVLLSSEGVGQPVLQVRAAHRRAGRPLGSRRAARVSAARVRAVRPELPDLGCASGERGPGGRRGRGRRGRARGPRRPRGGGGQASRSTTWSTQRVRASTSSGSIAGNIATRSWLRPSLR